MKYLNSKEYFLLTKEYGEKNKDIIPESRLLFLPRIVPDTDLISEEELETLVIKRGLDPSFVIWSISPIKSPFPITESHVTVYVFDTRPYVGS